MAYNFNPNFAKHLNAKENKYKHIARTGYENPYSNPGMFDLTPRRSAKSINFINDDNFEESVRMYKLEDIDHPNGWEFKELDMLGEMNFRMDDDYKMFSEIEIPSLKMDNEKIKAFIYKTDEGYVLETNRKYIFETFNKMIEFIDSIPIKSN
jgi:hypothetical protein